MKYRPKIGPGDFDTKTRLVSKFLDEGHKVKITIMFRGREVFHPELGKRILDRVAETIGEGAKIEADARLDGRNMTMVLAPDKRAKTAKTKGDGESAPAATGQRPVGQRHRPEDEGATAAPANEGATAAPTSNDESNEA